MSEINVMVALVRWTGTFSQSLVKEFDIFLYSFEDCILHSPQWSTRFCRSNGNTSFILRNGYHGSLPFINSAGFVAMGLGKWMKLPFNCHASWTAQFKDEIPARGRGFGHCQWLNKLCPNFGHSWLNRLSCPVGAFCFFFIFCKAHCTSPPGLISNKPTWEGGKRSVVSKTSSSNWKLVLELSILNHT